MEPDKSSCSDDFLCESALRKREGIRSKQGEISAGLWLSWRLASVGPMRDILYHKLYHRINSTLWQLFYSVIGQGLRFEKQRNKDNSQEKGGRY